MILDVETKLFELLDAAKPAATRLERFPDDPEKYTLRQKSALLLSYDGGRRGPNGDAGGPRRLRYDVVVFTKHLRSHEGAITLVELVIEALDGQAVLVDGAGTPGGQKKLRLSHVGDGFVDYEGGIWQYLVRIEAAAAR